MDDIEKQKRKRVADITTRAVDGYSNELNKLNLKKLEERKEKLQDTKDNLEANTITRGNASLQLKLVQDSIDDLLDKIDWDLNYDTSVDDSAARIFLKKTGMLVGGGHMIDQNDAVDKLEQELYGKKDD